MITILEYATLANHVYNPEAPLFGSLKNKFVIYKHTEINPSFDGWYIIADIDTAIKPSNAFFAQLYVKYVHGKPKVAVIGIRGTDNFANDVQDVKSWWKTFFDADARVKLPREYVTAANRFYLKAYPYLKDTLKIPSISRFVTGHSLGGAIAALLPTYKRLPLHAVTFNAPGIKHINDVHDYKHRVIGVRSTFDFVSALDYPIGPIWNCNVPEEMSQARSVFEIAAQHEKEGWSRLDIINDAIETADFFKSALPQHRMANLLSAIRRTQAAGVTAKQAAQHHEALIPSPAKALPSITYTNFAYNLELTGVLDGHQLHSPFCVNIHDKVAYQGV